MCFGAWGFGRGGVSKEWGSKSAVIWLEICNGSRSRPEVLLQAFSSYCNFVSVAQQVISTFFKLLQLRLSWRNKLFQVLTSYYNFVSLGATSYFNFSTVITTSSLWRNKLLQLFTSYFNFSTVITTS